jgi:hypothetical protein
MIIRRPSTSKIAPEHVDALDEGFKLFVCILLHDRWYSMCGGKGTNDYSVLSSSRLPNKLTEQRAHSTAERPEQRSQ